MLKWLVHLWHRIDGWMRRRASPASLLPRSIVRISTVAIARSAGLQIHSSALRRMMTLFAFAGSRKICPVVATKKAPAVLTSP